MKCLILSLKVIPNDTFKFGDERVMLFLQMLKVLIKCYICIKICDQRSLDITSTVDHCYTNPCHNSGTCSLSGSTYLCTCADGFMGENCTQGMTSTPLYTNVYRLIGIAAQHDECPPKCFYYCNALYPRFLSRIMNVSTERNKPGINCICFRIDQSSY